MSVITQRVAYRRKLWEIKKIKNLIITIREYDGYYVRIFRRRRLKDSVFHSSPLATELGSARLINLCGQP